MIWSHVLTSLAAFVIGCLAPIFCGVLVSLLGRLREQSRPGANGLNVFIAGAAAYLATSLALILALRVMPASVPLVALAYIVGVGAMRFRRRET